MNWNQQSKRTFGWIVNSLSAIALLGLYSFSMPLVAGITVATVLGLAQAANAYYVFKKEY